MTSITRVALVGPLPPPAGGMANLTLKLAQLLEQEGLSVDIIQQNRPYQPAWIGKLKGLRAAFRLIAYLFSLLQRIKGTDVVHIMANSGWSWHLFSVPAIIVSQLYRKPVVVNYHGGDAPRFFQRSWRWVAKSLAYVDSVIVPSHFLHRVFDDYNYRTHIIPNVVDSSVFKSTGKALDKDNLHFIATRNLEKIYGIDVIIKAFRQVVDKYPNAKLSVAGTGPELDALSELTKALSLIEHVTFTGRLTPEQMSDLYQSADVMINASTVDNAPSSLLEAMMSGIPVISTDAGGIPDMVSDGHDALLVEKNNASAIAEQVFKVIADDELRGQLIANGLATTKKYSWSNIWQQLLNSYLTAQQNRGTR